MQTKLQKPFFKRLANYYADVASCLRGDSAQAAVFPNATDIGDAREKIYINFLRRHLPANCEVMQGGFLFDLKGNESSQMDVIISANSSLRFRLDASSGSARSFACVEGTIAVASLKSNLTTENLKEALRNIATIPPTKSVDGRHNLLIKINDYANFPFKIVYAPSGVSEDTAMKAIEEALVSTPISRWPDLIHVAGKYALTRTFQVRIDQFGKTYPANTFICVTHNADLQALVFATTQIQLYAIAAHQIHFDYSDLIWGLANEI